MAARNFTRADDLVVLELLDAHQRVGLRGAKLRAHMAGITRSAWANGRLQGALSRNRVEAEPCACAKPENMDGGMPARWWAA